MATEEMIVSGWLVHIVDCHTQTEFPEAFVHFRVPLEKAKQNINISLWICCRTMSAAYIVGQN